MNLDSYIYGNEAARLLGVSRADDTWRAVARHGEIYPGHIDVLSIGRKKLARRDELAAFAAWYRANVGAGRVTDRRRKALREAIRSIQEGNQS